MEAWINDLGGFIARHAAWAGPVLGLITFGESLVLVGALFPATAIMVVAGGLAAAGVLDPVSLVLWCVAGAAAGDAVSYWLGRKAGPRAWRHRLLQPHRRSVARGRLFFRRYGTASIFVCRFMGPVRAFVPLIAGVTAMGQARFQAANVGSALVWVPAMLAPGYLAAEGIRGVPHIHEANLLALAGFAGLLLGLLALARLGLRRLRASMRPAPVRPLPRERLP